MRAKRGDAWAKSWDRDGGEVRSRRHGYTRRENMRGEKKARAKTDSGGGVIQDKQAKRRRTKEEIIGSIRHEDSR